MSRSSSRQSTQWDAGSQRRYSDDRTESHTVTSNRGADFHQIDTLIIGRMQKLVKVTPERSAFSKMVLMQCTIENYLLVARFTAADTVIHGIPYVHPGPESEEAAKALKLTHYDPQCYKDLRNRFKVDVDDYYRALCCTHWHQIALLNGNASKSGVQSFFAGSRYMVSIISKKESKVLRRLASPYQRHIQASPTTTLPQLYGHHSVKIDNHSIHFVVHNNVLRLDVSVTNALELSGSSNFKPADMSDMGLPKMPDPVHISVAPPHDKMLLSRLRDDINFLKQNKLSHYRLIAGRQRCFSDTDQGGWEAVSAPGSMHREVYQVGIVRIWRQGSSMPDKMTFGSAGHGPEVYGKKFLAAVEELFS